jgi:hypothetical protein
MFRSLDDGVMPGLCATILRTAIREIAHRLWGISRPRLLLSDIRGLPLRPHRLSVTRHCSDVGWRNAGGRDFYPPAMNKMSA